MRNNERLGRMVLAALLWLPLFAPAQADEKPPARTQAEKPATDVDPDAYAKMIQAVWEGSFPQPHEGLSEMEPEMDFFEAAQGLRAKHPELFGEAKGVLVVGWGPFEQGAKAGITSGDVLIRYGDTPLDSGQQLEDLIIRTSKTQRVLVRYLRGDRVREAAVHGGQLGITTRDMDEVLSSSTQASKMLQAARALREKRPELFGEAKGVLVVGWIPAGQATKAKLALGDILIHYGDTPLHSVGQLVELVGRIPGSQDVRLRYLRGTEVREAAIHGGRIGIEIRDVVKPKSSPDRIADEAEALFLEVSHIRKALPPADHPDIVATLIDLGTSVYNRGRDNEDPNPFDAPVDFKREAAVAFQAAVNIQKDRLPMDHRSVEFNVEAFAVSLQRNGRYDQAATLLLAAVEASKATLPAGHPAIAFYLRALAESYQKAERFAEAEPLLREVLAIQRAALPENDTELAVTLRSLAESLRSSRRYREAEQLYREALAIWSCALPTDDVRIAEALGDLGGLLRDTLRYDEAEPFYREALAIWKAAVSSGKPDLRNWSVAQKLNDLATLLANSGRYAEAEPLFRESLLMLKPIMPPGNIFLRRTIENLGMSLCATGHYAEAEQIYREALAADGGFHHLFNVGSLVSLAHLLKTTGRYGEAEQLYREALAIRKESLPADNPDIAESLDGLAEVLEAVGRYYEAEQLLRQGLAVRRVALPAGDRVMANSLNSLAGLLTTTGRWLSRT